MSYRNFDQILERVRAKSAEKRTVAVVAAEDHHTIEAVIQAAKEGMVRPLLIGRRAKIQDALLAMGERPTDYNILNATGAEEMVSIAAQLVNEGEAHFLMKGLIQTADLMRGLVNEKSGFRTGKLMSHLSIIQMPSYHKLVGLTDAALNPHPDLQQKTAIVENAVQTMIRMGFVTPKVAILAASEQVNAKMPETVDAAELKKLNQTGVLSGCIIEGPLSYDLMISEESAAIKGFVSPVCGEVDLMVTPNLATGNILLKALRYSAAAITAGIVVGGKAPIVLTSRAAEVESKYLPIVLAAAATLSPDE